MSMNWGLRLPEKSLLSEERGTKMDSHTDYVVCVQALSSGRGWKGQLSLFPKKRMWLSHGTYCLLF
jgi:hypothetical protein